MSCSEMVASVFFNDLLYKRAGAFSACPFMLLGTKRERDTFFLFENRMN